MKIIRLQETDSTNSFIKSLADAEHGTVVSCHTQTAGRGQRGNSWEAEPGKNLTFSMLLKPENIKAASQFAISRAVSLAIADCLEHWMHKVDHLTVKWPNDIYAGDRKLCGILIENVVNGDSIVRSVVGVGINVNQEKFLSDAPNPVSMLQLTGMQFDLDTLLEDICQTIESYVNAEDASMGIASRNEYFERLWRRNGFHPYIDAATGEKFEARIADVDPMGFLTLERLDGTSHAYAFKEVSALLR